VAGNLLFVYLYYLIRKTEGYLELKLLPVERKAATTRLLDQSAADDAEERRHDGHRGLSWTVDRAASAPMNGGSEESVLTGHRLLLNIGLITYRRPAVWYLQS
jgi:hypothetical protein